jgi:hypothetical protein
MSYAYLDLSFKPQVHSYSPLNKSNINVIQALKTIICSKLISTIIFQAYWDWNRFQMFQNINQHMYDLILRRIWGFVVGRSYWHCNKTKVKNSISRISLSFAIFFFLFFFKKKKETKKDRIWASILKYLSTNRNPFAVEISNMISLGILSLFSAMWKKKIN